MNENDMGRDGSPNTVNMEISNTVKNQADELIAEIRARKAEEESSHTHKWVLPTITDEPSTTMYSQAYVDQMRKKIHELEQLAKYQGDQIEAFAIRYETLQGEMCKLVEASAALQPPPIVITKGEAEDLGRYNLPPLDRPVLHVVQERMAYDNAMRVINDS